MRVGALILLVACSRTRPDPAAIVADPSDAKVAQPAPVPSAFAPTYCQKDNECAYDDPCTPHACVGKGEGGSVGCYRSAEPPGACVCAARECTLIRKDPASGASKSGCKSNADCVLEPATGTCRGGTSGVLHLHEGGAYCSCGAGTCTPQYSAPVPCKSTTDCSWEDNPRRPASATKVPRTKPPVVPCKTGGWDSVCRSGRCEIVIWKC